MESLKTIENSAEIEARIMKMSGIDDRRARRSKPEAAEADDLDDGEEGDPGFARAGLVGNGAQDGETGWR